MKPDMDDIALFYEIAFPKKNPVDRYFLLWVSRFDSPKRVWSFSDRKRRKVLQDMFEIFHGLAIDTNLNDREYCGSYDAW